MNLSQFGFSLLLLSSILYFFFSQQYASLKPKKGYQHPTWMTKYYNTTSKRQLIFIFSALSRLILPLLLFSYLHPCNAMIINQIIVDNIDPLYLVNVDSPFYNRQLYQTWDKFFDLYGYFIALIPVFYNYQKQFRLYHPYIPYILIMLLIYRLIAYLLWLYSHSNEKLFLYFPDFYTSLYYAISFSFLFNIKKKYLITIIIFISFILKIKHESYNHL